MLYALFQLLFFIRCFVFIPYEQNSPFSSDFLSNHVKNLVPEMSNSSDQRGQKKITKP